MSVYKSSQFIVIMISCVGNHGNELDGFKSMGLPEEKPLSRAMSRKSLDKNLDEDDMAVLEEQHRLLTQSNKGKSRVWRSRTEPMKPSAK